MHTAPRRPQLLSGLPSLSALSLVCAAVALSGCDVKAGPADPVAPTAATSMAAPLERPAAPALPPALEGCPVDAGALPGSTVFDAADPRLGKERVVVVLKERRRVALLEHGRLHRDAQGQPSCWRVALGVNALGLYPSGPKTRQGDRRTPEGWYRSSDKPWSQFYGAIAVHYPNKSDADAGLQGALISADQHQQIVAALSAGRKPPQETRLGGEILIHGGGSSSDWTLGCVAMDNADIDALRALLPNSMATDVLILP